MKKLALATGIALAVGSASSFAGGIRIDPTGSGVENIHAVTIESLGSSFGDLLLDGLMWAPKTGRTIGHDGFLNAGGLIPGYEITYVMSFDTDSAFVNDATDNIGTWSGTIAKKVTRFELYLDGTDGAGPLANITPREITTSANQPFGGADDTGIGYNDGILLVRGTFVIDPAQEFSISSTSGGTTTKLDVEATTLTKTLLTNGSLKLNIDFDPTTVNALFVLNGAALTSAKLDLAVNNGTLTPYSGAPRTLAADKYWDPLAGAFVVPSFGADGFNDFQCGLVLGLPVGTCDMVTSMNSTISFVGSVPEPGMLALMGAGVTLLGLRRRSRKNA